MGDLGWQRNTDEAARVAAEVNGTGGTLRVRVSSSIPTAAKGTREDAGSAGRVNPTVPLEPVVHELSVEKD